MKGWKTVTYGIAIMLVGIFADNDVQQFVADHWKSVVPLIGLGVVILRAVTNSPIFSKMKNTSLPIALLAIGLGFSLQGCAEYQAGAVAAHEAAKKAIENVNDDALSLEIEGLCAQPYSSLIRNASKRPQLALGIPALCGQLPPPLVTTVPSFQALPPPPR